VIWERITLRPGRSTSIFPHFQAKFKNELSAYEGAKGSAKFPLDQRIPLGLIRKIVKFRVKENLELAAAKK
jgi:uncharacterized protein YdhG (YjbR/CyaY superfamily)